MAIFRPRPIIALTTDFGLSDHYVGTMKGVVLGICPDAMLIDVCHEVPAFSIYAGAYTIDQAARYFPEGTIHVVVVDPGVGSSRRAMVVRACKQIFVVPDNGVLSMIMRRDPNSDAREIANRALFREPVSATFHGRDIFAPTAAMLGNEAIAFEGVGPTIAGMQVLTDLDPVESGDARWTGLVLSVDHFGNVITNFPSAQFGGLVSAWFLLEGGAVNVSRFCRTFSEAPVQECFLYAGSSGYLEIGINQKSAASATHLRPGDPVVLRGTARYNH